MEERANDSQERLGVLRRLIREGEASTQEELCDALRKKTYDVTQSTVSRDLRRIGAMKTTNSEGEVVYVLPEDHRPNLQSLGPDLSGLVIKVTANESMIVIHTAPGSASLIAAQLDAQREDLGILGTISGDDTIFIAPFSVKKISNVLKKVKDEYL